MVQLFGLGCIAIATIAAHGQKPAPTPAPLSDFQSWNELDISARLSHYLDATWVSQGRFSTQYPNPATYLSGLELRFKVGANLVLIPSYYYLAFKSPEGRSGHFEIPLFTAILQKRWEHWTFSDRNRILEAIGIGMHFWIYMNRPKLDYRVGPSSWGTSVVLSDEPFYFWTFHGWTRNRFSFGGRKTINKCCAADLYYLRQDDSHLQPRDINSLGFTLELRVR
jgi:hypothetical protein